MLKAYNRESYAKCLKILQNGADGRIDYLKTDYPLLFDIYQKYRKYLYSYNDSYDSKKMREIKNLLDFYLRNRKAAFEDSIEGTYSENEKKWINPKQTVGSYLARYANVELLQQIVQEKININSPGEFIGNYSLPAIYDLASMSNEGSNRGRFFDWVIDIKEKKVRMELLVDAGADVTLVDTKFGSATIFRYFNWYPFEEDYTELLDKMIQKGADLFKRDHDGYSCIYGMVMDFALESNTETYLEYVISRGLHVTREDLYRFAESWFSYMRGNEVTETELRRLEKIKKILEEDSKLTIGNL